jgi:hypothetical protein
MKLQNVFMKLDEILASPQAFGLRQRLPQPLHDSLRAMRDTLGQALKEQQGEGVPDDLEAELSQDADISCRTN